MESRSVVKVGVVVLAAAVIFTMLYLYLSHLNPNVYTVTVTFSDTKGLLRQSPVLMQGVTIGEVRAIDLDTTARPPAPTVYLSINNRYSIPEDSKFRIVVGFLINQPHIEIDPSREREILARDGTAKLVGEPPAVDLAALSSQLQVTLTKFNETFDTINTRFDASAKKIDRILDQTSTLLVSATGTIKDTRSLVSDPRMRNALLESVDNLRQITADARVTSTTLSQDLREFVASGRGKFDRLSNNLLDLLSKVGGTIDQANAIVAKLNEQITDPRLQQSLQETAELAKTTLARFNQIASDIRQLTGDPELQSNLKLSVENLRQTTEQSEQALKKVNRLLGRLTGDEKGEGGGGGILKRPLLPQTQLVTNASYQFNPDRFRLDVDALISAGPRNFVDVGLFDLGQNTRLNLQLGSRLTDTLSARYGLYASRLGVGLNWEPPTGVGIRADLWDTSRPRLDVRGLFRVNKDASVWVGADGLFQSTPRVLAGVQLKH